MVTSQEVAPQWLLHVVPHAGARISCIFLTRYIYDDDDHHRHNHHNHCYDDAGDTVLLVSTFASPLYKAVAMCSFVQSVSASATCFLYWIFVAGGEQLDC
jgi:hypothetical protein